VPDTDAPTRTRDELTELAWQVNVRLVQDAKGELADAIRRQALVEVDCALAARMRHVQGGGRGGTARPNPDDLVVVEEARGDTAAARERHAEAIQRFKAGVTAEQLAEVSS
jgi:hypothetical protein